MKSVTRKLKAVALDRMLRVSGLELKAEYVTSYPSPQNSLDLFAGEWASKLPPPLDNLVAGNLNLFDDPRIAWLREKIKIEGMNVLECGPLEGGHTYMLERMGVASIVSVEASTHAFMRCLILKELLGMKRSRFLLGDFVNYLRSETRYDLVLACGVIYHLVNPVEAIALMSKVSDQVYIWTHYYDEAKINARSGLAHHFQSRSEAEHEGFKHVLNKQIYQTRLGNAGFMGGSEAFSNWLSRKDLIGSLEFFGFNNIEIHFDDRDGAAGPNISLLATRNARWIS